MKGIILSIVLGITTLFGGEEAAEELLKTSGEYQVITIIDENKNKTTKEYFYAENGTTYVKDLSSGEWVER